MRATILQDSSRLDKMVQFVSQRRTMPAWIVLVAIIAVGAATSPYFFRTLNIINVLQSAVVLGILCIGQTYVILAAGIDLSVGSTISLVSVLSNGMMLGRNEMILPAVISMLCMGLAIGLFNALVTIKLKVPSFLVTLGVLFILSGAALIYTPKPYGQAAPALIKLINLSLGELPVSVIVIALLTAIAGLVLRRTAFGRHVYAVGGDAAVARLSGINVNKIKIATFLICGFTAALTGLYVAGWTTVGDPTVGTGYELSSIAAVIIGGTSLFGGRGGLVGTIAGVLILSVLSNILNLTNVGSFTQLMIRGAIIILVVSLYGRRR